MTEALQGIDVLVSTPGISADLDLDGLPPIVELGQVFDKSELIQKLSLLRFRRQVDLDLAGAGPSLIAALLDSRRFMCLPRRTSYWGATEALLERLEHLGLTTPAFRKALIDREQSASMLLDDRIGFPHATVPGSDRIVLAMAVIPRDHDEPGPRAVIVMGVPAKADYDDTILIDVYDEIIRLIADPDLLNDLSHLTSHEQLFWFLTDHLTQSATRSRRATSAQRRTT
ncbi:PTS sugar transporter subunit IIA [Acidipropionibacterium timonense]|uniref:PTS sugar transporter subunit IIA n=1 Tax=Acidipropionibacterium timonense TaxID=2161818 RepID=UPI001031F639|nr:PTS sugar transporter subunit IIA [Acidipropionibacterium timonense]